jgi:putative hydrolase of HD superfamily
VTQLDVPLVNQLLAFLAATDALKLIERANSITDGSRHENVAEHSWHVSLMSLIFADAAPEGTNHGHVRDLLVTHDLVEVFAGDTVIWDVISDEEVRERETAAARHLFGMLPGATGDHLLDLWLEFDRQETIEARFARALDALHPMLMSWGPTSTGHPRAAELHPAMILDRKRGWLEEFPDLWQIAQDSVQAAVERGLLGPDDDSGNHSAP